MNKLKTVILVLMSLLALGVTAMSASAEHLPLLSPTPNSWTGTSGAASLALEGTEVKCTSGTNSGGTTSTTLGTFKITFSGCKNGGSGCASLGMVATTGTIEVTGTWHLVKLAGSMTHRLVWFLLSATNNAQAVHIECQIVGLILIWGSVLGLIKDSELTWELHIEREGAGSTIKQKAGQTEFVNNSGETVHVTGLRGNVNGGAERPGGEESAENLFSWTTAVTIEEP